MKQTKLRKQPKYPMLVVTDPHSTAAWLEATAERLSDSDFDKLLPRQQLARHKAWKEMDYEHRFTQI